MSFLESVMRFFPEVSKPTQKKLSFKEKLKWTLITLVLFFVMSLIPLYGLGPNMLEQFEMLSIILGANFGSILSLGIGPIVTASIVLQLLNGSGIMKLDMHSPAGRKKFQAIQKLLAVFFIIFEALIYVFMGGLNPPTVYLNTAYYLPLQFVLVFQLCLGGFLIMFMDEVISKWGFGSGISLFIAAGVSQQIFLGALSPLASPKNPDVATGAIPALIQSIARGDPQSALIYFAQVASTILIFLIAVYSQSVKVEIPLSFGRVRGHGIRWPLNLFYTSNIPVILVAALLANIQLWGRLLDRWGWSILGTFSNNYPVSGLVAWVNSPNLMENILTGSVTLSHLAQSGVYLLIMILGSVIFAIFWMQTANMDAKSQANQIMSSGLQMPGFRRDPRILETILNRYIWPLTIMGGAAVGLLAAVADLSGALSRGTGILLTVMIVYKLYEEVAKQHMMDMHPMMRKFMG